MVFLLLAKILTVAVAAFHLYILHLEMFAWETKGPKVFRKFPKDLFPKTIVLAANQGLYNGFLAGRSLVIEDHLWQRRVALYFLGCVVVAGLYGAKTASKKIFYVQGLPALVAMALVFLSYE